MQITDLIPQRDPFLFIDKIESYDDKIITSMVKFDQRFDFFKGHFPKMPVVPGVILQEHCFQSAAALMALKNKSLLNDKLAVVSRIKNCKFQNICKMDALISTDTQLIEVLENAYIFRSKSKDQDSKKVILIDFICAIVDKI